jgi:hypothetical protein
LGLASLINRVVVKVNAGQTLVDVSGVTLYYLMQEMIQDNFAPYNVGKNLATIAAGLVLDFFIPISLNTRDEYGLVMLQSDATLVNMSITWGADTDVSATGVVASAVATPAMVVFEAPSNAEDMPMLDTIHQWLEEQITLTGAQTFDHNIARGGTIVGQYYFAPAGWTDCEFRLQQSNIIEKFTPAQHRLRQWLCSGKDPVLASAYTGEDKRIFLDFAGSDGLGQFGTVRDVINTGLLTSIFTRIAIVGSTTLYSLRRQLVPVN